MWKNKHRPDHRMMVLYDGAKDGLQVRFAAYVVNEGNIGIAFDLYVENPKLVGNSTGLVDRFGGWEDAYYLSRPDTTRLRTLLRRHSGEGTIKVVHRSFSWLEGLERLIAFC